IDQINEDNRQDVDLFLSNAGNISSSVGKEILINLARLSINHLVNANADDFYPEKSSFISRYSSETFRGILNDSGAATFSTAGYQQYKAYQNVFGTTPLITNQESKIRVKFGKGTAESMGFTNIKTPIGNVKFYIVNCETPFLLSLQDMDHLGIFFDNVSN
ncbi:hypothetical protein GcM3_015046, partial [Golovinomyces cichoracearum]